MNSNIHYVLETDQRINLQSYPVRACVLDRAYTLDGRSDPDSGTLQLKRSTLPACQSSLIAFERVCAVAATKGYIFSFYSTLRLLWQRQNVLPVVVLFTQLSDYCCRGRTSFPWLSCLLNSQIIVVEVERPSRGCPVLPSICSVNKC